MRFTLHQPLATQGQVRAQHHILALQAKGPGRGRGAVMQVDQTLHCASTGAPLASLQSVEFLRGDSGCGTHGLNNLSLACRAILKRDLPGQPGRLQAMAVRFAQPGLPGDTVRIEMQRRGDVIRFRARALERDVLLLDRGECRLQG